MIAIAAWAAGCRPVTPASPVTVIVLDSGVSRGWIPDVVGDTEPTMGHGTIMARIVRERCPTCRIVSIGAVGGSEEAEGIRGDEYLRGLSQVLEYVHEHHDETILVNISLGNGRYSQAEDELVTEVSRRGALVVAAVANDGQMAETYPAAYDPVVAVANAHAHGRAPSSNYGRYVDISAEGETGFVVTENIMGSFRSIGTSCAAAKVTGLLGELLARNPDLHPWGALQIVRQTAGPIQGRDFRNRHLGAGLINPSGALTRTGEVEHVPRTTTEIVFVLSVTVPFLIASWVYAARARNTNLERALEVAISCAGFAAWASLVWGLVPLKADSLVRFVAGVIAWAATVLVLRVVAFAGLGLGRDLRIALDSRRLRRIRRAADLSEGDVRFLVARAFVTAADARLSAQALSVLRLKRPATCRRCPQLGPLLADWDRLDAELSSVQPGSGSPLWVDRYRLAREADRLKREIVSEAARCGRRAEDTKRSADLWSR